MLGDGDGNTELLSMVSNEEKRGEEMGRWTADLEACGWQRHRPCTAWEQLLEETEHLQERPWLAAWCDHLRAC